MSSWFAEYALTPAGLQRDVLFSVDGGQFSEVQPGSESGGADRLPGIVLPGFANAHSHAFHRALRGRSGTVGDFWSWRRQMYELAGRLDPDSYYRLATAVYAEMVLAGFTTVGEFHYLHHGPGGRRYDDPREMGNALETAAAEAGIGLVLLDTLYLAGGLGPDGHTPPDEIQRRFVDTGVAEWAERAGSALAVHSVRAVPAQQLHEVRDIAGDRPLHVHLSEQPAENAAAQAFYGRTPTELLAAAGLLGPKTTAVHATHLSATDIAELGSTRICLCPTTERDLADGIGPAGALASRGCPLALGTDQHSLIDPFEEARGLEMHERLATGRRGNFTTGQLLNALTNHACLGIDGGGALEIGARADLVAVRLDSVRTAGIDPAQVLLAASVADVDTVLVGGDPVVRDGRHRLGDIPARLNSAIGELT
ncbi:MAG TPA: formimidoylglutamate deiminase [Mycobacteriales bacterium]|nr:formimidoylglutamate deiminase [Mycobacteriales bacterium]